MQRPTQVTYDSDEYESDESDHEYYENDELDGDDWECKYSGKDYYEASIAALIDALIDAFDQSNDANDDEYSEKFDALIRKHEEESIYTYERLYAKKIDLEIDLEELAREAFKPSRVMYQYMIDPSY